MTFEDRGWTDQARWGDWLKSHAERLAASQPREKDAVPASTVPPVLPSLGTTTRRLAGRRARRKA